MVQSKVLVALLVTSGSRVYSAELTRQPDDADVLSLLQTKAVVSRKLSEELHVNTDTENEWGLGGMFSSMVDAVHGAFQHEPNPVGDKQAALQLMEADKTVVVANTTSRGVLHLVHGCNQCGYHFCDKASIKESKTGIEESYLVGSALSEWGCDKVVNPYVVHDKGTRKVYAVEFIEAQSEKKSAVEKQSEATSVDSKKETSEKKASKTGDKDNVKSKGKAEWPDFSWPHLEAKEEITEKAPRHSVDKKPKSGTKSADKKKKKEDKDGGKAKKVKQTKSKLTSDDSSVSDNKEARKDNIPSAKTLKSDKLATETKQDSMLIENGATTADKEAAKKPDDDLTGNVFDDKKSTNHKSTHDRESKLAASSKKDEEEKKEHSSAKSVKSTKSDKHELQASSRKDEEEKKEHSSAKSVKSMKSDKHEHKISSSKETHEDETKKEHSSAKSANSAKSDKHEPKISSKEKEEEEEKTALSTTSAKSVKSDKHEPKISSNENTDEVKKEHSSAKSAKSVKIEKHEPKISRSKEEKEEKKEHSSAKSAKSIKSDKHESKINSKEEKEEDKKEHSSATSAKSVKSDKQHPLDSMLMEHGRATIDKEDFPNLEIPHVIQKLAEAAEEKMTGKVSEDKSVAEKTASVHAKSKSTAESKETKKEDERASSSKLEGSTDALDEHSSAESVMSDKQEEKTSKHKAKASASHKRHSAE